MGNSHSADSSNKQWSTSTRSFEQQQRSAPNSTAATQSSYNPQSAPPSVLVTPAHSAAPNQPSRVLVDIRGANLDSNNYAVWVEKQPRRQRAQRAAEAMEGGVALFSSTFQALGGVFVTVLTIQKLLEELKLLRGLRRSTKSAGNPSARSSSSTAAKSVAGTAETAFALPRQLADQLSRASSKGRPQESAESDTALSADGSSRGRHKQQSAWSSIAGLQHVKMLLQEVTVLPLVRPDLFTGVRSPPSAVLLYGPPGTGKTLLARAVAAASGASFFAVTGSSVLSKWYGESEQNVRRLFEDAAAAAPAVIFIDEVDSLLAKRGGFGSDGPGGAGEASRRVTNEFLAFIDGIATNSGPQRDTSRLNWSFNQASSAAAGRVVVIAATNAPWELDEAALSRFAARLLVPLPDAAARQAILQDAMQGVKHSLTQDCFKRIAEQADGYSGRDLTAVCREASMHPMRELWGGRILEGEAPPHCQQQQQLVAAVTAALQQGSSSKKLRHGLERWKRQTGAAWCDVDQVLRAGETAAAQQQPQRQQQQQKQGVLELQQQLRCDDTQDQADVVGMPPQLLQQQQLLESTAASTADPTRSGSHSRPQQASLDSSSASSTASGCMCGVTSEEQHSTDTESVVPSCTHPAAGAMQTPRSRLLPSNACQRGSDSNKPLAAGTMSSSRSSSRTVPKTWTLEDLIALPADAVRPVTVGDVQWALSQVGQVESLTDKYEEWTRKFGSGDGAQRTSRDAWRFMPMYM
eukprot:GHUV01003700.1.p1 GENE.GHUV01003700.1~~GHUV01003700.1.p1  ORF type:complete len:749 (+),score=279.78 GHUV01003700.1:282-2528(+)